MIRFFWALLTVRRPVLLVVQGVAADTAAAAVLAVDRWMVGFD